MRFQHSGNASGYKEDLLGAQLRNLASRDHLGRPVHHKQHAVQAITRRFEKIPFIDKYLERRKRQGGSFQTAQDLMKFQTMAISPSSVKRQK
jgi:hypothetical protein